MRDLYEDLLASSRQHALLRLAAVVSLVVFAVALLAVGDTSVWALVALAALGTACAVNPHGALPAVVMVYVVVVWAVGVTVPWTPWTVVGAVALLVFHTACSLAAALPPQAAVPAALWALYAVRLGAVTAVTCLVWLLALVQRVAAVPGGVSAGVTGLSVLGAALLLHYAFVTHRQGDAGAAARKARARPPARSARRRP